MSDITVTTRADQIPIAPGKLVSDVIEGDRRTARFKSTNPILGFFSVQSAEYAVTKREHTGIDMEIYHHPAHGLMRSACSMPWRCRSTTSRRTLVPTSSITRGDQFPGYATFAQAFAGTVPYSERIGFIANTADEDDIDYVTYVTAHEYGHQYWAHQLISAYMQGGTIMVETMAQYSALMVMKEIYGEEQIRRFLSTSSMPTCRRAGGGHRGAAAQSRRESGIHSLPKRRGRNVSLAGPAWRRASECHVGGAARSL